MDKDILKALVELTVPRRDDILIMLEDVTGIPAEILKKASDEDLVWRRRGMK